MNAEKIEFTNRTYEFILKTSLILLVLLNSYAFVISLNLKVLIPVFVNLTVLVLIVNRHKISKRIVRLWALVFFILAPGLVVISNMLLSTSSSIDFFSSEFLLRYARIVFGLLIFIGANNFIRKEIKDKMNIDDHLIY